MNYIATKRLYLTADQQRVVDVASSDAGYLFRGLGQVVTQKEVERYNLAGTDLVRPVTPQAGKEDVVATEQATATTAPQPEKKADVEVPTHKAVLEVPKKKGKK